jgi:hypothetical protein
MGNFFGHGNLLFDWIFILTRFITIVGSQSNSVSVGTAYSTIRQWTQASCRSGRYRSLAADELSMAARGVDFSQIKAPGASLSRMQE